MSDISAPALEKAKAKVLELVPGAGKVETQVRLLLQYSTVQYSPRAQS